MSNYGIVEYFGCNDESHPCGYCKGIKTTDYGMWAHQLSTLNYQNLIDRNWRRSGKYCYKPILNKTCCPMYTIRCDALNFKLKKSQKKVIKKFNGFVKTGEKSSKRCESQVQDIGVNTDCPKDEPILDEIEAKKVFKIQANQSLKSEEPIVTTNKSIENIVTEESMSEQTVEDKPIQRTNRKAKHIRKERKLKKIMDREKCDQKTAQNLMSLQFKEKVAKNDKTKSLEEYLTETESLVNNKHKLTIKYVSTTTNKYEDTFKDSHKVYQKYQMSIHGDGIDECTQKQFKRFLIDSPLENQDFEGQVCDNLPDHFGSYHQQYWLDNRLIAVGVIDILPHCISSVYLYYDPEFDFLSLGTYSALREIYLIQKLQRLIPDLKYYYMGFYIHSCPKMKYKGKFMPSDLLCPETFSWHPIEKCVPKLEVTKYCRFEDNPKTIDSEGNNIADTKIKILNNGTVMSYLQYKTSRNVRTSEDKQIKEYAKLIGKNCSNQILLYRS